MNYNDWLESQNYSPATINKYNEFHRSIKKKQLTQEDITQILKKRNYPLMRAWLKNYVMYLKETDEEKYVKLKVPPQKGRSKRLGTMSKFLKPEELELFFAALPKREELICKLLYLAAARRSQVLNAIVSHVNVEDCELFLPGDVTGGKRGRDRVAILSDELVHELVEWVNVNKLESVDKLFSIGFTRLWDILHKTGLRVIGKPVSTHWMKRSRGYYYDVILGLPLEERQYALGHADPKTTQDRYSFKKGKGVLDKLRVIVNDE